MKQGRKFRIFIASQTREPNSRIGGFGPVVQPFGAFYGRLKGRLGPVQALIATAHKLARVVYVMLKFKRPFRPSTAAQYEQKFRQREIAYLQRKAKRIGFDHPRTRCFSVSEC